MRMSSRERTLRDNPGEPEQNRLLMLLPRAEYRRVTSRMERVRLPTKQVICATGKPILHVYFPVRGIASIVIGAGDKLGVEIGMIGKEGMVGIPVFLGADCCPMHVFAQMPLEAMRITTADFKEAIKSNRALAEVLCHYTLALMNQIAQSAACNRLHATEQRLSRWLLMAHDGIGSDQLPLTQEFLAQMLGVRRPSVTAVAGMLQKAGLIAYRRGRITILDRAGLEATACECYGIVKKEFEVLLGRPRH